MKKVFCFSLSALCVVCLYLCMVFDVGFWRYKRLEYANPWVHNLFTIKDYLNTQPTSKPRLLIMGGSSTLFGFNGSVFNEKSEYHFINYGSHAGLPMNYHVDKIISSARENDIIFLPLEFQYYTRSEPYRDYWYIHNMLVWGGDYRKYISSFQILRAYFQNGIWVITQSWFRELTKPNPSFIWEVESDERALREIKQIWSDNTKLRFRHNFRSLSPYGDFCNQEGNIRQINSSYLDANLKPSSFFIHEYKRLQEFAKTKNIQIFLTYPPTVENPKFSLEDPLTHQKIENLKQQLQKHDIQIYGDFKDFHFPMEYFYDTEYHLNNKGAVLRTEAFIRLLESMKETGVI